MVRQQGRGWSTALLVLRACPNQRDGSRFGFLVSRRVGNAVARNRTKRRLREIVRREPMEDGWDMVFIARPRIGQAPFGEIQEAVRALLRRGRLQRRASVGGENRKEAMI